MCGTEYYYCNNNCLDSFNDPLWKISFCCENCKNVYNACSRYNSGKITKEEAKELLDKCDLSNKEEYTNATKNIIEEIYFEETVNIQDDEVEETAETLPKKRKSKKRTDSN
jgi:hypothetical protein